MSIMKNIKLILSLAASLAVLYGCEDELKPGTPLIPVEEENLTGVKAYVNDLASGNSHETPYNSTPLFIELLPDTASFYVNLNMAAAQDVVVKATVEGLPEDCYAFVSGQDQVTIPAGKRVSSGDIRLVLQSSDALYDLSEYTEAKVRIQIVSGPAEIGRNNNSFNWIIHNRVTNVFLKHQMMSATDGLTPLQKDFWTPITNFYSANALTDGRTGNYSYKELSSGPYITMDLGKETEIQAMGFVPYMATYSYRYYWMGSAEIFHSNDNETWTSQGVIEFENPVTDEWQLVCFYAPVTARYFKIIPLSNIGDDYGYVLIAEAAPFVE